MMTSKTLSNVTKVGARFAMRFAIFFGFASLSGTDFTENFVSLLWMATVFCAAIAALKRGSFADRSLNHWDEAAMFGALFCILSGFNTPFAQ